jgi:hypothetical protein
LDKGDEAEDKGRCTASTSEPAVKAVKVFTAVSELERKRKAEEGTTEQVAQLEAGSTTVRPYFEI